VRQEDDQVEADGGRDDEPDRHEDRPDRNRALVGHDPSLPIAPTVTAGWGSPGVAD
jgi:hypothetical protein